MRKIQIESAFVGAYKFLFTNIGSIIGIIWFPLLLLIGVTVVFALQVVPAGWLHGDFTPPADIDSYMLMKLPMLMLGGLWIVVAGVVLSAMIKTGIMERALGLKTKATFVYFSLGANVWRMAGAAILYVVIYIALEVAFTLVLGIVSAVLMAIPHMPGVVTGLADAVIWIGGLAAGIYIMVRLFFFLPAVIVAENRIGIERAWALGRGNVLRAVGLVVILVLPVLIVAGIAIYGLVASTVVVEAIRQQPQTDAQVFHFLKSLLPVVPVMAGIYAVAAVSMAGLVLGAIGQAYRSVTASDQAQ